MASEMHYCMATLHYGPHGARWYACLVFGLRPRASNKRTKNQTVRLSEEEFAEVQRMADLLTQQTGVRYTVGDVLREGLRLLQEKLADRGGSAH